MPGVRAEWSDACKWNVSLGDNIGKKIIRLFFKEKQGPKMEKVVQHRKSALSRSPSEKLMSITHRDELSRSGDWPARAARLFSRNLKLLLENPSFNFYVRAEAISRAERASPENSILYSFTHSELNCIQFIIKSTLHALKSCS